MARVLNALGVHLAVYGNHDFGKCEKSVGINTSNRTVLVCTFATCTSVRKIISNTKNHNHIYTCTGICTSVCHAEFLQQILVWIKIVKLSQETNFPWLLSNVFDNLNNRPLAEGKTSHMIEWNGKKVSFLSNDVTRPHFVNS